MCFLNFAFGGLGVGLQPGSPPLGMALVWTVHISGSLDACNMSVNRVTWGIFYLNV
jgi:hypothetical protein